MTRFLDVPAMSRLVQQVGVPRFLRDLTQAITDDYLRWNDFDKSARLACHSPGGVIELMPVADADRFAFKYVNGHPRNTGRGLFTVMAFGVLAEVDTGYPLLLSELTLTTALRTAATSALAAKWLARPASRRMALIGNGAQSEFQALAFHTLLGIDEIRVFDTDPAATDKLMRNLAAIPALRVIRAESAAQAVRGADIVTTVTADKALATILTPDMIEPGMHINAVGGDCPGKTELHADVLRGARVIVEYEPQTRSEGDIQQLPADFPVTELWRVLSYRAAGREYARQVTVFDSVGFALEDYSALRYVYELAQQHGIGEDVALIPPGTDPKDLFAHVRQVPVAPIANVALAAVPVARSPRVERTFPAPVESPPRVLHPRKEAAHRLIEPAGRRQSREVTSAFHDPRLRCGDALHEVAHSYVQVSEVERASSDPHRHLDVLNAPPCRDRGELFTR